MVTPMPFRLSRHGPAKHSLILLLVLFGVVACGDENDPTAPPPDPVRVSVSPTQLALEQGQTRQLSASVTGSSRGVVWSSSNTTVAVVDQAGTVLAVGPGTASIRARAVENQSATAAATVTVSQQQPGTGGGGGGGSGGGGDLTIVVNNSLLNTIQISVNGRAVGTVPPQSTRQTSVANTGDVQVSWDLVRSRTSEGSPVGDAIGGSFNPVSGTAGTINLTVDAVIGDDFIFTPIIRNRTGVRLLMGVNMGLQAQNRCNCVVPAGSSGTSIGYYRLFSNSNVRAYRESSGYGGSYIFWDNFAQSVNRSTGRIGLTADSPPSALIDGGDAGGDFVGGLMPNVESQFSPDGGPNFPESDVPDSPRW